MTSTPSLSILQRQSASDFIHERFGLYFPPERFDDMLRAITKATQESGFDSIDRYVCWLLTNQLTDKQLEPLITNLTIGETYFFRDTKLFSGLRNTVFPEIRKNSSNNTVRVWSAACSTGEEPYSLAILLDQVQSFSPDWQVNLYATDVNVKSLAKARAGEYSQWSFRGIDENLKSSYFSQVNSHRWRLNDRIRRKVEFSYLNLAVHPLTVGTNGTQLFDVILCRNVLMYFSAQRRQEILQHLVGMLTPTGWLVVSPSEVGIVDIPELSIIDVDGMLMHRKGVYQKVKNSPVPWRNPQPLEQRRVGSSCGHPPTRVVPAVVNKPKIPPSTPQSVTMEGADGLTSVLSLIEDREYRAAIDCLMCIIDDEESGNSLTAEPLFLLARCLANVGQSSEAEEWLGKALQLDRLNPSGYYLLATIQQERGDLIQARRSLEQSLYLDAKYIMATFALGMLLTLHDGEKEQGAKMFSRVKSLLSRLNQEDIVPDSGGLTVSHLDKMLETLT